MTIFRKPIYFKCKIQYFSLEDSFSQPGGGIPSEKDIKYSVKKFLNVSWILRIWKNPCCTAYISMLFRGIIQILNSKKLFHKFQVLLVASCNIIIYNTLEKKYFKIFFSV